MNGLGFEWNRGKEFAELHEKGIKRIKKVL